MSIHARAWSPDRDGEDAAGPSPPQRPLRPGWTTGTCAAAAAAAACEALLTGHFPAVVSVALPGGTTARLPLARRERTAACATASVIKDAGDDPDVTHGAEIIAHVSAGTPGAGVRFRAGPGVGTVTLPGLALAVGEPAINPGPRAIIARAIAEVAGRCGGTGDVVVTVEIPGGEALAARTLNARLGILGGLSILGTTGIVVPYSCAAWIHSIHRGIDVARAAGLAHLAAATGSTSEAAVRRLYDLPEAALIDMGDFVGGTLKYVRRHPVPRLTLAGGFAKLAKLAQGHLYLHSARSRLDHGALVDELARLGADAATLDRARAAVTGGHILALARAAGLPLADAIAGRALEVARSITGAAIRLEVLVFTRAGEPVGHAG
jgi:cobalt-precorrin-5B (C1)-methyltransferase